ncbi:PKD domain-containing protein, partial [Jatrophihabitans endophyticus]|uniref:PKD domain-containing protein n=1 Tax=Jatrophihabitans endophyticus TaxID=1206085 RepID=UPI0019E91934
GTYPVQLTVTDDQGTSASLSQPVSPVGTTTTFVNDRFQRTVGKGLGSADVGGAWSTVGTTSNFSVGGGTANLLLPKAGTQDEGYVGPAVTDANITTSFTVSAVPVGGPLYATVSGRRVSAGTGYQSKLLLNPNGTVLIEIVRSINNTATVLKSLTVPGLTYTSGSSLSVRTQATGTNPTLVQARVWRTGTTEPTGWQVSASDSTAALQTAGTTGVIAYLSSAVANAPITVADSSFVAQSSGPAQNQPPTAAFTASCSQLSCRFDASGSTDPDGSIAGYAWAFGDGASGAGSTSTHAYVTAGTYPVTLTVTDNSGATASVTHTVTATSPPVGQPPTARFTYSCTTLTCSFDGSTSVDSDGDPVVAWAWDFGDGTSATGATTTHTFAAAGSQSVRLTVTDDDGLTGSVTQSVTVSASTDFASDSFNRTVGNGWGTADVGGAWALAGTASRASVGSGAGSLRLDPSAQVECYLPSVARTDADVLVQGSVAQRPTGGPLYLTATPRRVGAGLRYGAQAVLNADGSVTLQLNRWVSNAATVLSSIKVPGLTYSGGATIEVRVEATGTSPTTLRARAWLSTSPEPSTWQVTATDSAAGLQTSGSVGLIGYASGNVTNGPLVLQVNDFEAKPTG